MVFEDLKVAIMSRFRPDGRREVYCQRPSRVSSSGDRCLECVSPEEAFAHHDLSPGTAPHENEREYVHRNTHSLQGNSAMRAGNRHTRNTISGVIIQGTNMNINLHNGNTSVLYRPPFRVPSSELDPAGGGGHTRQRTPGPTKPIEDIPRDTRDRPRPTSSSRTAGSPRGGGSAAAQSWTSHPRALSPETNAILEWQRRQGADLSAPRQPTKVSPPGSPVSHHPAQHVDAEQQAIWDSIRASSSSPDRARRNGTPRRQHHRRGGFWEEEQRAWELTHWEALQRAEYARAPPDASDPTRPRTKLAPAPVRRPYAAAPPFAPAPATYTRDPATGAEAERRLGRGAPEQNYRATNHAPRARYTPDTPPRPARYDDARDHGRHDGRSFRRPAPDTAGRRRTPQPICVSISYGHTSPGPLPPASPASPASCRRNSALSGR
ncbi:hypothetical protein EsH8_VIII_000968 [Colletotrichum jinshuiense]